MFVPGRAEPWTATGVALEQGQAFAFRPDGAAITWLRFGMPGSISGPAGQGAIRVAANTTPASDCAVNDVAYGMLVARVGHTTMPIGAGGTFVAPEDGWLELAVNDNQAFHNDNSGGYASASPRPSPDPSTLDARSHRSGCRGMQAVEIGPDQAEHGAEAHPTIDLWSKPNRCATLSGRRFDARRAMMGPALGNRPRLSVPTQWVLECLLDDPAREWSGMELARANGLRAGSVYPLLAKLEAIGWLQSRWEDAPPGPARAPARRFYRLGGANAPQVRQALAATSRRVAGATWGVTRGEA